ncbi:Sugar lactone lactonase YvrE [Promicromonospora umidemergens]|uniref:SMP-30/Gluconolactonase/LRE-like region domain-containing protein n=1 Tax=Promicromonospora umidemergens TaxID=629679 RepID=A0ABP8XZX9_9MICO|nr:SMP-30/gluconolactonase/LRE family protein [Promicromonospora umidemergens]MCP2284178.1 Sugar lactone lactonase YvrE [Promicromonospora umidemergens]
MTVRPTRGIDELVEPTAEMEQIVTGCVFTEGPVWLPDGALLFSDITADRLMRWSPDVGQSVVRSPNGKGNGMTLDNEGRLIVCEHATSTVTRTAVPLGEREVIAAHWSGAELNSPNDVVVMRDGGILFTDPSFGRTLPTVGVVRDVPQQHRGVYRIPPEGGEPQLLVADVEQPNGLCLSPDQSVLYVGDTVRAHIRSFDMANRSGPLRDAGLFAEGISLTPARDDAYVDGMKVDELGNVYVTAPGGIWVYTPSGERLGTIEVPEQAANLNWGGDDWKTLYITALTSVYRIRTTVAGNRPAYMC